MSDFDDDYIGLSRLLLDDDAKLAEHLKQVEAQKEFKREMLEGQWKGVPRLTRPEQADCLPDPVERGYVEF